MARLAHTAWQQLNGNKTLELANPSFELGAVGWDKLTTGSSEYLAPVDGKALRQVGQ
jgi:hypothetical protein